MVKSLTAKALSWQKSLPPSSARDQVIATGKPQDKRAKAVKPNAAKPGIDRAAIFKQKDSNHDSKLTLDEYLDRFPDQAEGRRRFPTFDTNHDGSLSESEFIRAGKP